MATSRKAAKARTRQKLLDATLKVLHRDGRAGLTTGRVAEAAGVAQPTFYVHFSDMDEALTEAADLVAQRMLERLRDYRAGLTMGSPMDLVRAAFSASVKALVRDQKLAELFLRHRRDAGTPLGERWAKVTQQARLDLVRDMERWGLQASLPDLNIYAEILVGMTLAAAEGVVDKRIDNVDLLLDELAQFTVAGLNAGVARAVEPASSGTRPSNRGASGQDASTSGQGASGPD